MKIGSILILSYALFLDAAAQTFDVQQFEGAMPNISTRCDSNAFEVTADLIVWTAREVGSDCWAEVVISGPEALNNVLQVDFGWEPGFRLGLGYGMKHDQWNTQIFYTWFHTIGKDAISSSPGTVHSTFLGNFYVDNPTGAGLSGPSYQKASIDWTIHFNMFDWELGRSYWVSNSLSLRPFMGLKGGWIDQSIHSKWENPDLLAPEFFKVGTEDLENNFWGIGPEIGIYSRWNLYRGQSLLYLFGNLTGALLFGHWSFSDHFQNDISQEVIVDLQNINSGASMVRTFMGFGWDAAFSHHHYRFSTKLGYEMQFWLDQLQLYSFTGGRLVNELTLQGGTLEFSCEF